MVFFYSLCLPYLNFIMHLMTIIPSLPEDLDKIFELYDEATRFQKTKTSFYWMPFSRTMVEQEILEGRQFKIMDNERIAGIFAITNSDELIWKEKNIQPSIYLHRIVIADNYKGKNLLDAVIDWAVDFSKSNHLKYVRLDTFADNKKLVNYYIKSGFALIDIVTMENSEALPPHYNNAKLALLEIKI